MRLRATVAYDGTAYSQVTSMESGEDEEGT